MVAVPVIVTRAEPGLSETCARLSAAGYQAIPSPALELVAMPETALDLSGINDLIFTSANGVRFFRERSNADNLTAWCVGPSTAEAARAAGFIDVRESAGNAEDLCNFILTHDTPPVGRMLHVANSAAAGDVARTLREAGQNVAFAALYATKSTQGLSQTAQDLLKTGQPAIVLIHSAKGAAACRAQAAAYQLSAVTVVAISRAAAAPLLGAGTKAVILADAPNEAALMRALDTAGLML